MKNINIKKAVLCGLGYVTVKWLILLAVGGALYKNGYWNNWYLTAIPVIGITIFAIKRRIKKIKTGTPVSRTDL
jgi:hypothetical protein